MTKPYNRTYLNQVASHVTPNGMNCLMFSETTTSSKKITSNEAVIMEGMLLGLCLNGMAKIKINFKEYTLKAGEVLAILPSQIVRLLDKSPDFHIESLYISLDFIVSLPLPKQFNNLPNTRKLPCLSVSESIMQNLLEYFSFIIKQYNHALPAYRDSIVKGLLFSLLTEFIAIYESSEIAKKRTASSRQEELADSFIKLLMAHFKEERSVSFYADKLCITPKHLSKTVKEATGRSVMDWIHTVLIISAKMQLKNTTKTVSEISEELQISNLSFFCRLFKEHTGMSPLEYRNM